MNQLFFANNNNKTRKRKGLFRTLSIILFIVKSTLYTMYANNTASHKPTYVILFLLRIKSNKVKYIVRKIIQCFWF